MTDNAPWMEELSAALATAKEELAQLGHDLNVIDFPGLTHKTGIAEPTIRRLFTGEPVDAHEVNLPFKDRLAFLVRTRLREDGAAHKPSEIAAAIGVSKATITHLLKGVRNPGFEVTRQLAEYFDVDPGFFGVRGDRALLRALEPALRQARLLTSIKSQEVDLLALRGTLEGGSPQLAQELQEALLSVIAASQRPPTPVEPEELSADDRELEEFAATVRSLPVRKRKGVMRVLRTVVGLD